MRNLRQIVANLLPPSITGELILFLNERSLAWPTRSGNYHVVKLPMFKSDRTIPTVTETLYGTHIGSEKHCRMLEEIYTYPGFVELKENDHLVVDVGAYIGTFAQIALPKSDEVIAIDPFAKVDNSLERNLAGHEGTSIVPKAAWNEPSTIEIQLSGRPSKTSIWKPLKESLNQSVSVAADTVPNIVRDEGHNEIDYLKIEGEGAEPEILQGLFEDDIFVRKIAVDAGPERTGEPICDEITEVLEKNGYECRTKDEAPYWGENIVFGRIKSQ